MYKDFIEAIFLIFFFWLYLKKVKPKVKNFLKNKRFNRITKLEVEGKYEELAKHYEKKSKLARKQNEKENYLGLAATHRHQSEKAEEHFLKALSLSFANDRIVIEQNLTIVLMQQNRYKEAYEILSKLHEKGRTPILSYFLTLLVYEKNKEAINWLNSWGHKEPKKLEAFKELLSYLPEKTNSMEGARKLINDSRVGKFKETIEFLIDKWEVEKEMLQPDFFEKLKKEGEILLEEVKSLPNLFANANLRFIMKHLSFVVSFTESVSKLKKLVVMIENYESFLEETALDSSLKAKLLKYYRKIRFAESKVFSANSYDIPDIKNMIEGQFSKDVSILFSYPNIQMFESKELQKAFFVQVVHKETHSPTFVYLIPLQEAHDLVSLFEPIFQIEKESPELKGITEEIIYCAYMNWEKDVISAFSKLPEKYQNQMFSFVEKMRAYYLN